MLRTHRWYALAYFGLISIACAATEAFQLLEMRRQKRRVGARKGGECRRLTGILQSISVLLEFDARICAVAEQRRIAGIARYRLGIQLRGSQKVAGCSEKAGQLAGQMNAIRSAEHT